LNEGLLKYVLRIKALRDGYAHLGTDRRQQPFSKVRKEAVEREPIASHGFVNQLLFLRLFNHDSFHFIPIARELANGLAKYGKKFKFSQHIVQQ
jgi:hypothetical protein